MPATTATWRRGSTGWRESRLEGRVLIRRLVYVAFFVEVGLLLIVVPWSPFWERNYFADAWPAFRPVLTNNFVRGAVSGLGIVNLCAAFADLAALFARRHHSPPLGERPERHTP